MILIIALGVLSIIIAGYVLCLLMDGGRLRQLARKRYQIDFCAKVRGMTPIQIVNKEKGHLIRNFDYRLRAPRPFCKVAATENGCFEIQFDCHEAKINLTVGPEALRRMVICGMVALIEGSGAFVSESGDLLHIGPNGRLEVPASDERLALVFETAKALVQASA